MLGEYFPVPTAHLAAQAALYLEGVAGEFGEARRGEPIADLRAQIAVGVDTAGTRLDPQRRDGRRRKEGVVRIEAEGGEEGAARRKLR